MVSFVAAWILRHVWEGKVTDFDHSREATAKRVHTAHPNWSEARRQRAIHNAQKRNAAGWVAYQLRHGWIPMFSDVVDGYRAARLSHAEWAKDRPEAPVKPGPSWVTQLKAAAKAGWARAKAAHAKASAPKTEPTEQSAPAKPPSGPNKPTPPAPRKPGPPEYDPPQPHTTTLTVVRDQTATRPAKEPTMSGEVAGYEAAKAFTADLIRQMQGLANQLEQYEADLIAGGIGKDAATMGSLAALKDSFNHAQVCATQHLTGLNSHSQGAEYAQDKGEAAAHTGWLKSGA